MKLSSANSKGDGDFRLEGLLPFPFTFMMAVLQGGGGRAPVNCFMGLTGVSSTKIWDCVLSSPRSSVLGFGLSLAAGAGGSGGGSDDKLDFDRLKPLLMLTSLVNTRFLFVTALASASRDTESERDRASVEAESGSRRGWAEREREMEVDVEAVLVKEGSRERDDVAGKVF
jgi:hypothetical protein